MGRCIARQGNRRETQLKHRESAAGHVGAGLTKQRRDLAGRDRYGTEAGGAGNTAGAAQVRERRLSTHAESEAMHEK